VSRSTRNPLLLTVGLIGLLAAAEARAQVGGPPPPGGLPPGTVVQPGMRQPYAIPLKPMPGQLSKFVPTWKDAQQQCNMRLSSHDSGQWGTFDAG